MTRNVNRRTPLWSVLALGALLAATGCKSNNAMLDHVTEGLDALNAIQTSGKPIPAEALKSCAGVALVECFQMGVVFGGMGGNGVAVKKLASGWSPPVAIGVVKGDFGALIGAQHLDIVMVFEDATRFEQFVAGSSYFSAGADGTAANATGNTQASGPPVKMYVTAGGLYGGASIGGLGVIFKKDANAVAYGAEATPQDILDGKYPQPPGGIDLGQKLDTAAR